MTAMIQKTAMSVAPRFRDGWFETFIVLLVELFQGFRHSEGARRLRVGCRLVARRLPSRCLLEAVQAQFARHYQRTLAQWRCPPCS